MNFMNWDDDLFEEQKKAVCHIGSHARLLAGPGTGKTLALTRRIAYLITEKKVRPNQILALTFTRAAAFELRNRVSEILTDRKIKSKPQICTLHSFALRQLIRNSNLIEPLPQPIRIADGWEERNIIFEDLKMILNYDINTIRKRFNQLSADWQKLATDKKDWEKNFPDPRFLAAWRHHRTIFGYTLRSELVYLLKRVFEQTEQFSLESDYSYLLIDEYQDLNRCDLEVIFALRDKDIEVFAAGDDDQSIYGFRFAHPEGIRRFDKDYVPSNTFTLGTCIRCDRKIIELASFIAGLDENRLEKPLKCRENADDGDIQILRFKNQFSEAKGVATICKNLLMYKNYAPNDIMILMRSDTHGAFSSVIKKIFEEKNIPITVQAADSPLETDEGRKLLSFLHLLENDYDCLALKTLMKKGNNKIGPKCFSHIYELARKKDEIFSITARRIMKKPELIPNLGKRISREMQEIQNILNQNKKKFEKLYESHEKEKLLETLQKLAEIIISDREIRTKILNYLDSIITESNSTNHKELLRAISSSMEDVEQELDSESVNIMTMHKAKGLTKKAVIIIAAEDEYIPGRQTGEGEDDERRLLYVSLSRAKHFLAITYCSRRIGQQRHMGRGNGQLKRTLTRFLRDVPITPIIGESYIKKNEK